MVQTKNRRIRKSIKLPPEIVNAFIAVLQLEGTVKLSPLGKFSLANRKPRKAYNAFRKQVIIHQPRTNIKFKISKTLRDEMQTM